MTRNHKYDYTLLSREYIFDAEPRPISYSDLADKHGMSRSLLTERGAKEDWTGQRRAFREKLGIKTTEIMVDELTKFQVATRERMMSMTLKYLTKYEAALDSGEIVPTTRDMLGIAQLTRALIGDASGNRQPGEEALLNEDTPMSTEALRRAVDQLDLLEAGELNGSAAGDAAEESPPAARQN